MFVTSLLVFAVFRANDAPFGLFGVADAFLHLLEDGITRELIFTVTRAFGDTGVVQVDLSIIYEEVSQVNNLLSTTTFACARYYWYGCGCLVLN